MLIQFQNRNVKQSENINAKKGNQLNRMFRVKQQLNQPLIIPLEIELLTNERRK